jgi:uncharacterized damage-inducible protein DinB
MKKLKSDELIDRLITDVRQLVLAARHLKQTDVVKLGMQPAEGKWSVAQCLEHLNAYSRYYLPAITKATAVVNNDHDAWFTPGYWGDRFTKMMLPKTVYEVTNKMKAMKSYTPERSLNVEKVFNEFFEHQENLLHLLELSRQRNLGAIRIPISISKFIKLKLGDTFRFFIAHQQRHMVQARNAVKALGVTTDKFPVILQAVPQ